MLELQIIIASIMRRYDIVLEDPDFVVRLPHASLTSPSVDLLLVLARHEGRFLAQTSRLPNWHQASGGILVSRAFILDLGIHFTVHYSFLCTYTKLIHWQHQC